MTTRLLANAVLARLREQLEPGVTVYDGFVPRTPNKPAPKYVAFYPHHPPLARDRLVPVPSNTLLRFQLTSAGLTRDNAQAVADAACRALVGVRVTAAGWAPAPVQQDEAFSAPIQPDNDVTPPMFYAVDQYLIAASAVPA